jgi:hypothetical protein
MFPNTQKSNCYCGLMQDDFRKLISFPSGTKQDAVDGVQLTQKL